MNTSTILSSLVSILSADVSLSSWTREITDVYVEVPYLKGTYAIIYVIAGNPVASSKQHMRVKRYDLPVIIRIEQRKAKMSDSEVELNKIVDKVIDVVELNRKKITGVNGVTNVEIDKEMDSTEVDTRLTEIELMLDIIE